MAEVNSNETLWDFFIAHSHVDKDSALELYNHLKDKSKVFLDEKSISPGGDWDLEIPKALKSSTVIIALVSDSLNTAHYAREEVVLSIKLSRKLPNQCLVIPIYLNGFNDSSDDMYYGLRLKQGLDVIKEGGIENIAQKLIFISSNFKNEIVQNVEVALAPQSHVLLQFPPGPAVEPDLIRRSIIEAFATLIRRFEARVIIAEANAFRKEANPQDENVTIINFNYLLDENRVTPFEFWQEVFTEARLNSPRMLAALVLSVPDDRFSIQAKSARKKLLESLKEIKS